MAFGKIVPAGVLVGALLCVVQGVDEGKELEYDYNGTTEFVIPFKKTHHNMMAFKAKVIIQQSGEQYKILMKDVEMGTYHGDKLDHDHGARRNFGHEHVGKIYMEKNERVTEAVERPFVITTKTEDGIKRFVHIETPAGDPVWSVNVKKGLASLLNIRISPAEQTYTSDESTIQGDCKVYWQVRNVTDHEHGSHKMMNISRTVDHEHCTKIAGKIYGALQGNPCVKCESVNTHPLTMISRGWYSFFTDGGKMKLNYAYGFSEIIHAPYTENGIVTNLVTYQHLRLRETREKTDMAISGDMEVHQNLNMEFHRDNSFDRKLDMKASNHYIHKESVTSADAAINHLKELSHVHVDEKNDIESGDDKDFALIFSKLLEELTSFDYEKTEKLFNEVVKTADDDTRHHLEKIFVESVASAGYNAGIQFLVDKFLANELKPEYLRNFFLSLNRGFKEPTATGLDTLLGFCNSDLVKQNHRRSDCLLVYTSVIAEFCRISVFAPPFANPVCQEQKLQRQAFDKIVPEYKTAKAEGEDAMDTYIHVSTNLRTYKAVDFLVDAMEDKELDLFLRMDAVSGLVKAVPAHTERYRRHLFELYMDYTDPYELRVIAAVAILKSNPPLSLLYSMVNQLHYEKSDQLKTYVVSLFQEIDRNEHPCFKPIAQHVRYLIDDIMRSFKSEWARKDYLTSHMHLSAGYDPKFDFGGHTIFSMIMSENSYLPREMRLIVGDYLANFIYDTASVHIRQSGFDQILDKFADPKGTGKAMGRSLWHFFGKKRFARSAATYQQEVEDLDKKIHLKTKEYEPLKLDISVSAYGHDLLSLHFNQSDIMAMMKPDAGSEGTHKTWLTKDSDFHRMINFRDLTFTVPTGFGMPASLDVHQPTVMSHSRKDSSLTPHDDGSVNLKLNRKLTLEGHLQESFRLDLPYDGISFGVGMDQRTSLNLPLKVDAAINVLAGKITHNRDFLLPRKVLNYHFKPFTFLKRANEVEPNVMDIDGEEDLHKFNHTLLGDTHGVDLSISGHRMVSEIVPGCLKRWLSDAGFRSKYYYFAANPMWYARKLDISVKPSAHDASTGRTIEVSIERSDPEQPQPPSKFEEYTKDLDNSYVQVLHVDSTLNGDKERKASLELRYSFKPDRTEHWFQLFYERTPFSSKETHNTKACIDAKATQTVTDWQKLNKGQIAGINVGQNINVMMDMKYGKDCKTGPTVHANLKYEHSDEQKRWLEDLTKEDSHMEHNPYRTLYKKCLKLMEQGLEMSYKCHKFIVVTSQLNKMTLDVGMDGVTLPKNRLTEFLTTMYMRYKGSYYPYLHSYVMRGNDSTPGRIHVESNSRDTEEQTREADIKFVLPYHESTYNAVPVPKKAHWAPRTATHFGQTNLITYHNAYYYRYCDMQRNSVRSFDRKIYPVTDTKCYTVFAKDCSPHKVFTLLAKNNDDGNKDILLYVDEYKIEVTLKDGVYSIVINGVVTMIPEHGLKIIRNTRGDGLITITNHGNIIFIESNVYGIKVYTIRHSVYVQAANYYRGKLCGLCGDMNFDGQHEFHTPDGCHHTTGTSFARAFMIPDDTCQVPPPDATLDTPVCA